MSKIRVLVVDDSALVRQMLTEMLQTDPDIEVVGTASNPYVAREKIKRLNPDVLTLDIAMPRMDGLTFLHHLMRLHPMPVVMVSALTADGAEMAFHALELGAVDFVSKPKLDLAHSLQDCTEEIITKVKAASTVHMHVLEQRVTSARDIPPRYTADAILRPQYGSYGASRRETTEPIVALG